MSIISYSLKSIGVRALDPPMPTCLLVSAFIRFLDQRRATLSVLLPAVNSINLAALILCGCIGVVVRLDVDPRILHVNQLELYGRRESTETSELSGPNRIKPLNKLGSRSCHSREA